MVFKIIVGWFIFVLFVFFWSACRTFKISKVGYFAKGYNLASGKRLNLLLLERFPLSKLPAGPTPVIMKSSLWSNLSSQISQFLNNMHGLDSVLLLFIYFSFSENSQKDPISFSKWQVQQNNCDFLIWKAPSVPKTGCDDHLNVNLKLNRFHSG